MKTGKIISFRPNQEDLRIIEEVRAADENSIRRITDSDIIRHALSLIKLRHGGKRIVPSKPEMAMIAVAKKHEDIANEIVGNILTNEQIERGYQWLKGELCDADGFPVEQLNGDYVRKGGEIYATDPGRASLKETAKSNAAEIVEESEYGKVNPKMAEILEQTPKADSIKKHTDPGILSQQDGVDEDYDSIN